MKARLLYQRKSEENQQGYSNTYEKNLRENELILKVSNSIAGEVKLTGEQLDTNGDALVDGITFVISGIQDTINDILWSHKSSATKNIYIKDKKVADYNIVMQGTDNVGVMGTRYAHLGVIVHEFLHSYGYPDLYRYNNSGKPVQDWDIMASTYEKPQLPLVYSRKEYGQAPITTPEITTDGEYVLEPSNSLNINGIQRYLLKTLVY